MSFDRIDLHQLEQLLNQATAVVAMQEIHAGNNQPTVIGLRHDVDDNNNSLDTAVKIARWEAARCYRSTYFILHTASYWNSETFLRAKLEEIALQGHEIGIHANAIADALTNGGHPDDILYEALETLRGWGHPVIGVAPHGDELCRIARFVSDEMFVECARPEMGEPDRVLWHEGRELALSPTSLAEFGLLYETYRLPKGDYLSDTGGEWSQPLDGLHGNGQLHVLQHPDWWSDAFSVEQVAA